MTELSILGGAVGDGRANDVGQPAQKWGADPVQVLREELTAAVALLPALPPPDPADRYHIQNLTALWLEADKSEHTRRAYYTDLAAWLGWCTRTGLDPMAARRADVDAWKATITVTGPSGAVRKAAPSSIARKLAAISSWYRYLQSNDITAINPMAAVQRPQANTAGPQPALDEDSVAVLLDHTEARAHANNSEASWRDAALLSLLFYTGLRVSAVTTATTSDLDHDSGHTILRYHKKGGTRDFVPLVPAVLQPLRRYLQLRAIREHTTVDQLHGPLLATTPHRYRTDLPGGQALIQRDVWNTLRALARQAGITSAATITPHTARRTTGTLLLAHGVPVQKVQDLLGHADIRTTRDRYDAHRHKLQTSSVHTLAQILADHRHQRPTVSTPEGHNPTR
ncbi:MAG: tyrosine-type recombinase/integrase [Pseudonocardiaceae bacterium]